jgi:hypothetical protein
MIKMIDRWMILIALFVVATNATRVSLTDTQAYHDARPCMKNCFGNIGHEVNYLAQNLKVDNTEEGICRLDIQPSGVARLRYCIGNACDDNAFDVKYGVGLYTAYCTSAGYVTPGATPTPTSGNCLPPLPPVTITVTSIQTVFATSAAKRGIMLPLQNFFAARF